MRKTCIMLLLAVLTVLVACRGGLMQAEKEPPRPPAGFFLELSDTLQWTLTTDPAFTPRIEYLKDLADTLAVYGILAEALPGQEFRFGYHDGNVYADWIRTKKENKTAYLADDSLLLDTEFHVLITHMGLDDDSLEVEVLGGASYLESLTSYAMDVFAYPCHDHDMRAMGFLRDHIYLGGRNGTRGYMPWGSFLLDGVEQFNGWGAVSLFESSVGLTCSEVQAVDPENMAAWLAGGYLPEWLERKQWIQLYTHTDDPSVTGTPVLDDEHLGAFLDALLATDDVWIAPFGEVAAHVRQTHEPSDPGGLVWRDASSPEQPWQDHRCAFSFSTDDGFLANLYAYQPVFAARGLSYTAFLNKHKIVHAAEWAESPYMDPGEVTILSQSGVEIGNHGANHRRLLRPEACQVRLDGAENTFTLEIRSESGKKILRLWKECATGVP